MRRLLDQRNQRAPAKVLVSEISLSNIGDSSTHGAD
jgi:hypothetical protein